MSRFFSNLPAMFAVRGVFAILFGIVALAWPGITLTALILLFGAYALVDGVTALVAAITNAESVIPRWVLALDGVAGIIAGLVAFFFPALTSIALLYIIAAWSLVTGSLLIGAAVAGPRFEPAWLMVVDGVISVVFGIVLVAYPGSGILAIVWTLGFFGIFSGVSMLVAAVRLRHATSSARTSFGGALGRSAV